MTTAKLCLASPTVKASTSASSSDRLSRPSLQLLSSFHSPSLSSPFAPSCSSFSTYSRLSYRCPASCLRPRHHPPYAYGSGPSISSSGFLRTTHSSSSSKTTINSPSPSIAPRPTRSEQPREMAPKTKFELKTPKGTKDCMFLHILMKV